MRISVRSPGGAPAPQRLSVALCTYNGARFLAEQLASIGDQERQPDELVICDDRSTDHTVEIARDFARQAPFPVHVRVNAENLGSTRNFERAIRECSGDLIALADQDDVWLPAKLARCEQAILAHPAADAAFTDAEIVDEHLRPTGRTLWSAVGFDTALQRRFRRDPFTVLVARQVVTGATLVFRAARRDLLLPIPRRVVHDAWIAALLATVATLVPIAEPLMRYRQHDRNQIGARVPSLWARAHLARDARVSEAATLATLFGGIDHRLCRMAIPVPAEQLAELRGRARHLRTRAALSPRRRHRLAPVLQELAAGGYRRYSRGIRSALVDLLT